MTGKLLFRIVPIALLAGWTAMAAGSGGIGLAVANGRFAVDNSQAWNAATLFDGSVVDAGAVSADIRLNDGARMRLAPDSRAAVYERKLVLERGSGEMRASAGYRIEAHTLNIVASRPETSALVKIENSRVVRVAAAAGAVRVTNPRGVLVAEIEAGKSLDFQPQDAGAAAPTRAAGCLLEKSGAFVLAEQTTNVVLELRGRGLDAEMGNRVEITGSATDDHVSVKEASQVIRVAGLRRVAKGGCAMVAKKLGPGAAAGGTAAATGAAAGTATAGTSAGIGAGTVAVIGGVAAAATVGGLAAAGSLPGQTQNPPSASR